ELPEQARKVVAELVDGCEGADARWMPRDVIAEPAADGKVSVVNAIARHTSLRPPLHGAHQQANLALAVSAVDVLAARTGLGAPDDAQWAEALAGVRWPGRMELCDGADEAAGWQGTYLLDGAHNPHALRAVIPAVEPLLGETPVVVFAAMRDK